MFHSAWSIAVMVVIVTVQVNDSFQLIDWERVEILNGSR